MISWKTLGISPHGKYYKPFPWSSWADNTANKHPYRMCVSCPPVPFKNYKHQRIDAFYYDPLGPAEALKWNRSDMCPDNTAYCIRTWQGPLPPAKNEYKDPEAWVHPHPNVFQVSKPFVRGGSRKGKSGGPTATSD